MTTLYYLPIAICKSILHILHDKCFDNFKQCYNIIIKQKERMKNDNIAFNLTLLGLFFLCDDSNIISIAVVDKYKLDRIYTFPQYRNKGFATDILNKILIFGIKNNMPYWSPINSNVKKLFEQNNWLPLTNKLNKDGSQNYIHKIFFKKYTEEYSKKGIIISNQIIKILLLILLPSKYIKQINPA